MRSLIACAGATCSRPRYRSGKNTQLISAEWGNSNEFPHPIVYGGEVFFQLDQDYFQRLIGEILRKMCGRSHDHCLPARYVRILSRAVRKCEPNVSISYKERNQIRMRVHLGFFARAVTPTYHAHTIVFIFDLVMLRIHAHCVGADCRFCHV